MGQKKKVSPTTGTRKRVVRTGNFKTKKATEKVTPESSIDENEEDELSPRERYMSLGDHLEEFRKRIIWIVLVLTAISSVAGYFSFDIHSQLVAPYTRASGGHELILQDVYGPFDVVVKLSLLTGFIVSFPIILSIIWGFVTPAVDRFTAFIGHFSVAVSGLLFWGGVVFCWLYVMPLSLEFMLSNFLLPGTSPQLSVERYYSFVFMILLGGGMVFQLPLVLVILGATGILSVDFHRRTWKHVIVGIFIFAAIITPPDPISQILFAAPLVVLYMVAVMIVWLIERSRRKRDAVETDEEAADNMA